MSNNIEFLREELAAMETRRATLTAESADTERAARTARAAVMAGTGGTGPLTEAEARSKALEGALIVLDNSIEVTRDYLNEAVSKQSKEEALARAREIVAQLDAAHTEHEQIWLEAEAALSDSIAEILHTQETVQKLKREFAALPAFDYRALGVAGDVVTRNLKDPFNASSAGAAYGVNAGVHAVLNQRQNEQDRQRAQEFARKRKPELTLKSPGVSTSPPVADDENLDRDLDDLHRRGYRDERDYQRTKEANA